MKVHEPRLPLMTLNELQESNETGFKIVMEVIRHAGKQLYDASFATRKLGLEKCIETLMDLVDTGFAKVMYSEEEDMLYLGFFNSSNGQYQAPAYAAEDQDPVWNPDVDGPVFDEYGDDIDDPEWSPKEDSGDVG